MTRYGSVKLGERFLEDRSYIMLVYPERSQTTSKNINSTKKVKLPFYETPLVTESKNARHATYKLLGRNSDLYSYLGSDSRNFKLSFNITLPHLLHFLKETPWTSKAYLFNQVPKFPVMKRDTENYLSYSNPVKQSSMNDYENLQAVDKAIDSYYGQDGIRIPESVSIFESEFAELQGREAGINSDVAAGSTNAGGVTLSPFINYIKNLFQQEEPSANSVTAKKVKAAYLYYINLIRSTVLGSSQEGLGAPIVRLNFGPLYQDVPCIVRKYDLNIEESAGYDLETLIPNRVRVALDLTEVRVGDFTSHAPDMFGPSDDNVQTWESLFAYGTFDPRGEPKLASPTMKEQYGGQKEADRSRLERRIGR